MLHDQEMLTGLQARQHNRAMTLTSCRCCWEGMGCVEWITCLSVPFEDCLKVCIQLAGCIGSILIGLLAFAAAEVVEGNCVNASIEQGAHLCCVLHCQ